MRISQIASWSECEAMALQSPPRVARTHVAAYVGTLAHALVADLPKPLPEGRLGFEATTPTLHAAEIQGRSIAIVARRLLYERGWGVLASEEEVRSDDLVGHLDIRAWHSDDGEAIIDLKTGAQVGAAWLQVGGYIALSGGTVQWGGVLHVPRQRINKDVTGTLELRPARSLIETFNANMARITQVVEGATPTRSPGVHCGRCRAADCPVRIGVTP